MIWIEWGRFLIGAACLLFGLGIFAIEMAGVFRFRYVLNRMHAAAMGCLLYTSPSPRDLARSRMPSSA